MPENSHRNPYVILGVDFGCSSEEARRGFIGAVRRARSPDAPFTDDDVTWALHQVEHADQDHGGSVDIFRIPADPQLFHASGNGLFDPLPVPLRRQTRPLDESGLSRLGMEALAEALGACAGDIAASVVLPKPYGRGRDVES